VDPAINRLKEVIEKGENIPATVTAGREYESEMESQESENS